MKGAPVSCHVSWREGELNSTQGVLGSDYVASSKMPITTTAYRPDLLTHWRPVNGTGGVFGVNRLLPASVGTEVFSAYPLADYLHLGGPAAAFKAADGDYHVVCAMHRLALLAANQAGKVFFYHFTHGPLLSPGCDRPEVAAGQNQWDPILVGEFTTHVRLYFSGWIG